MTKTLIYINILATLLLLFAGFDKILNIGILRDAGLLLVIFTAATFLLITTFLQLTIRNK
jgi:hypothetical protein